MLDVGMAAGRSLRLEAKRAVEVVKAVVDVPVSIDKLDPAEIKEAVTTGADLILSADAGNLNAIAQFTRDVPVASIPSNQLRGIFPPTPTARVQLLEQLIKKPNVSASAKSSAT